MLAVVSMIMTVVLTFFNNGRISNDGLIKISSLLD